MRLWRIIAIATAAEAAAVSALAGLLGLAGAGNGWLDVINQFAPVWLVVGVVGGAGAQLLLPPGRRRWSLLALAGFGVVVDLFLIAPEGVASMAAGFRSEQRPPALKVVTFNVWSENVDAARTADVILAADPDVVAVQEESGSFGAARARLMQALPFRVACPAGSDLALYSRTKPIAQSCPVKPRAFDRAIWIRVRDRQGRVDTVITTHFPWPFPPGPRAEQLNRISALLKSLGPEQDAILVGDFNMTPWTFAMWRQDKALRPMVRQSHGISTWPVRIGRLKTRVPFPFLAIDQVYTGPGWRDCKIRRLPRAGSDHLGLAAALYH